MASLSILDLICRIIFIDLQATVNPNLLFFISFFILFLVYCISGSATSMQIRINEAFRNPDFDPQARC